jgi:hypothetical protein
MRTVVIVPVVSEVETGVNAVVTVVDELSGEVLLQYSKFYETNSSISRRLIIDHAIEWCRDNKYEKVLIDTGLNGMLLPVETTNLF